MKARFANIDLVVYDMFRCTDLKPEEVDQVEITEIAENDFRVEYDSGNQFGGFLYYVRITETETEYEFDIYRTAYGDTGIIVRDKYLNYLRTLDHETREVINAAKE